MGGVFQKLRRVLALRLVARQGVLSTVPLDVLFGLEIVKNDVVRCRQVLNFVDEVNL
jgi:hypothetical protein